MIELEIFLDPFKKMISEVNQGDQTAENIEPQPSSSGTKRTRNGDPISNKKAKDSSIVIGMDMVGFKELIIDHQKHPNHFPFATLVLITDAPLSIDLGPNAISLESWVWGSAREGYQFTQHLNLSNNETLIAQLRSQVIEIQNVYNLIQKNYLLPSQSHFNLLADGRLELRMQLWWTPTIISDLKDGSCNPRNNWPVPLLLSLHSPCEKFSNVLPLLPVTTKNTPITVPKLLTKLLDYQVESVHWLLSCEHVALDTSNTLTPCAKRREPFWVNIDSHQEIYINLCSNATSEDQSELVVENPGGYLTI